MNIPSVREWPKRVQGWLILMSGFLMWYLAKQVGGGLPTVPLPEIGETSLEVAVMMFGFAYMVGLGFGDQLKRSIQGRKPKETDDS